MSTTVGTTPQGPVVKLGIPDSEDYPRLVYTAPYFTQVPLAELIEPSVQESVEGLLPSLLPPYVDSAAQAAVQQLAVLLTGSTMSGPLYLNPTMPTQPSQAATMAYVDAMVATAGVPEVPAVPAGQTWARQVGQWVPLDPTGGVFLPLTGGTMQGQINMSGYAINNLAALPNMPNGAAPASWVLQQLAAVSLYQGTWDMDTYTPDLTQVSTHVNGYTWIAITTSTSGVVIGPAIPGLQGTTVFNGDTIIWSNIQGVFNRIHAGGLSLAEAQALFLPFAGGTMTGPLLAFENPTETMEVATMGWVESLLPTGGVIPDAPQDGQIYGRNGLTHSWLPVLALAGGLMTGAITLAGNATAALNPVPLQQMTSAISGAVAGYLPLTGGTLSGPLNLPGNATSGTQAIPLQQASGMLAGYMPVSGGTFTGPITAPGPSTIGSVGFASGSITGTGLSVGTTGTVACGTVTATGNGSFGNNLTVTGSVTGGSGSFGVGGQLNPANAIFTAMNNGGACAQFAANAGASGGITVMVRYDRLDGSFMSFQFGPSTITGFIQTTDGATTIYGTSSDARLKQDIEPLDLAYAASVIDALEPVSFHWKALPDADKSSGFVAQDVKRIFPAAVIEGGEDEMTRPWGTDDGKLMPVVIAELKALRARVAALEARA